MSSMSDPNAPKPPEQMLPDSWRQFIRQTLGPVDWAWSKFPKTQILKFCQSQKAPKLKQLLQMVPVLHKKYQQNCEIFRQLLILLYLLLIKGCAMTSKQLIEISLAVLEQLLAYRFIIICSLSKSSVITEVYDYIDSWLRILVPTVFAVCQLNSGKQKDKKKGREKQKQCENKPKTFLSILFSANKKISHNSVKEKDSLCDVKNISKNNQDQLLILFQCLLVSKIRNHLNHSSLFEFDNIMRRLYSPEKFRMIYQGKGCVTHIQNKQKQRRKLQQQGLFSSIIQTSVLVPARLDELDYHVYDLHLQLPSTEPQINEPKPQKQGGPLVRLRKIQSSLPMQQWVVNSFMLRTQPNPIKLSINSILTKMKPIQMYRFLSLLEIYGSNPHIQVLNDYIPDERVLQFFTKFLLGQNLIEAAHNLCSLSKQYKKQDQPGTSQIRMQYSYKSDQFNSILQKCLNEATKLQAQSDRSLLIQQLKTKLMGIKSNIQLPNNGNAGNNPSLMMKNKNMNGNGNGNGNNNSKLDDFWKK